MIVGRNPNFAIDPRFRYRPQSKRRVAVLSLVLVGFDNFTLGVVAVEPSVVTFADNDKGHLWFCLD